MGLLVADLGTAAELRGKQMCGVAGKTDVRGGRENKCVGWRQRLPVQMYMYEEAEPVGRGTSTLGSGLGQPSAPPSRAPPVNQGGPSGRDSRGVCGSEESPERVGPSSDPYEEAERVYYTINPANLSARLNGARLLQSSIEAESAPVGVDAEHTRPDRSYPGKESGRRALCGFLVAGFAVLTTLVIVGLTMIVLTQKEMSRLSNTVDALKRDLDKGQNRTASLEQRLHEMSKAYGKMRI
ncbi:hypothetical protein Bbelb_115600 [Branchiostoma belcheri]|nr:hypothetical protein Bbelb_115600 [Branchiostoma belcheri]